jgi:hypothetical protein
MTAVTQSLPRTGPRPDHLTGTSRAGVIDRWVYVFTAASFIVVTLVGFIPDSLGKIAAVQAGQRPPFPIVLHMHAVLMGSFLLLLLAQTLLMGTGRAELHRRLGLAALVLGPALVVVGFILVPTMYHWLWNSLQTASAQARPELEKALRAKENVLLLQTRIGLLFPLALFIGLRARTSNPGLHKRMMILAVAVALPAAFDRITWIPSTLPARPLSPDLYVLLAISPMLIWDVVRNRSVHMAYLIWFALILPATVAVHVLWDTPGWHATARQLMGV